MKKEDDKVEAEFRKREKDPRFIEYMKLLVERSKDHSKLIDGHEATKQLKKELGLS